MAAPTVFVSSTYIDLRDIRESLRVFIENYGMMPVLFEKGQIFYDHMQPPDESCYRTAGNCHFLILIIGGRYGSPASSEKSAHRKSARSYKSITLKEYLAARDANVPIFIFVEQAVLTEYGTWRRNKARKDFQSAYVDNVMVFRLIGDIRRQDRNNVITPFVNLSDILATLKAQWAGMIRDTIERRKASRASIVDAVTRVNGHALFVFRSMRGLSFTALERLTDIDRKTLRSLESVRVHKKLTPSCFRECPIETIRKLEEVLSCPGELEVTSNGRNFTSLRMGYYNLYKGIKIGEERHLKMLGMDDTPPVLPFATKAVAFDFDGTLTHSPGDLTTWERIWEALGYNAEDCAFYHHQFSRGHISHEQWCAITTAKFRARKLTRDKLKKIADGIKLVDGVQTTLRTLSDQGVSLFLVSGSIKELIREVLGELYDLFDDVKANSFRFDSSGAIESIVGTKYDFHGKANYMKELQMERDYSPVEMLFVGNSLNDIWVARAGVPTLCVNPHLTDPMNTKHWTYCIWRMTDLNQIMRYVTSSSTASAKEVEPSAAANGLMPIAEP